ncbi:hypothetical protein LTR37_002571 [Vermiconidia calcicola]|uniref:Uncharacterized protein n=1 Tax=Vermiconidia calcicola TaxID=1690605 RepID=A0ACC3NSN7_9PEZI|nr:hypothetical protein LTR37_002571 [Vermiconidia calcicola]
MGTSAPPTDSTERHMSTAADTSHYSNATEYGSGTTAGPGVGNKTDASESSTTGKLMEKAGNVLNKEDLAEKGRKKQEGNET